MWQKLVQRRQTYRHGLRTGGFESLELRLTMAAELIDTISYGGQRLGAIVANSATDKVYVALEDAHAIAVLDGGSGTQIASVPSLGFHALAVDETADELYVSHQFAGSVRVIDGASDSVETDIAVPGLVHTIGKVAVDPGTHRLFVVRANNDDIAVFDTLSRSFVTAFASPGGVDPGDTQWLAVDPVTHRLFATNPYSNSVTVYDGSSGAIQAVVPVSGFPDGIVVDPTTHRVLVSQYFGDAISIIDAAPGSVHENTVVVDSMPVGWAPAGVAVNSALGHFYVANSGDQSLAVVDVATGQVLETVALGLQASELAVLPDSGRIYAPGPFSMAIVEDSGTVLPPRDVDAIGGRVWADSNNDARIDFGESGLEGATVQLDGVDELGHAVIRTTLTAADGSYLFDHLLPGTYSVRELSMPGGWIDGRDAIGKVSGVPVGVVSNDLFTGIVLGESQAGSDYNFGERPAPSGPIRDDQAEEIGFWQSSQGLSLIRSFNGAPTSTKLGDWLSATLPQTFGWLSGKSNTEVASAYVAAFRSTLGPTPKLEAQFFATALNLYATSSELGGVPGACSEFRVSRFGIGAATVSVGNSGSAFGLPNRAVATVLDLLQAADRQSVAGRLYGANSRLRQQANSVFARINDGD